MGGRPSICVLNNYKSVLLKDILFVSDVIEICSAKFTIGNESIFVTGLIAHLKKLNYHNLMLFYSMF